MYQTIAARNARRNRFRAICLTTLITLALIAGFVYSGHPEWQAMLDGWINQVMGIAPADAPTP